MIVPTPDATPVTIPLADPTEAMNGLLLVHVPPVVASASEMVNPIHTAEGPVMAAGERLTVMDLIAVQLPME